MIKNAAARIARALALRAGRRLSIQGWSNLDAELARWRPGQAIFWWRDDDAVDSTPALATLLTLRQRFGLPLSLAVIPAYAQPALAEQVRAQDGLSVLVHGWDHTDHGSAKSPQGGNKKAELTADRNLRQVRAQLTEGVARLRALFGDVCQPVLVPPFNQIAPVLIPAVRAAGLTHISIDLDFTGLDLPGMNVHADLIDWRRGTAATEVAVVRDLVLALRLRRFGLVRRTSPIGIMTHHLKHDDACWALTEKILRYLARHEAVSFSMLKLRS